MDIVTAFLNGVIGDDTPFLMELPKELHDVDTDKYAGQLLKSLYGLKKSPREWHKVLTDFLKEQGFEPLACEPCIYVKLTSDGPVIVSIYVDDLLCIGKTKQAVNEIKQSIGSRFKANDLGPVSHILGLNEVRDRPNKTLTISQETSITKVLDKFGMKDCDAVSTPLVEFLSKDCPSKPNTMLPHTQSTDKLWDH